jgi:hypothetical protein
MFNQKQIKVKQNKVQTIPFTIHGEEDQLISKYPEFFG